MRHSRDRFDLMMGATVLMLIGFSVFDRATSGIAVAVVITYSIVSRRIVRRHEGAAKRDILLLGVAFNAVFAAVALAVSLWHEDDPWITALFLSVLSAGFSWSEWRGSTRRHREPAEVA